ncbi:MAG: DUF5329 domain-containing protein [Gammaproteobacteria bacterium]|nr:DUF5329 domain-containing protein [Gammaproteobacteria bacterium]
MAVLSLHGTLAAQMLRACIVALLAIATVGRAADVAPTEQARIEYLLQVVGSMHDAQFIRNGKAYDSSAAVSHLRSKLRAAGARVRTAEDFIRYCASKSSLSGQPYEVRFADGQVTLAADFLRQRLLEFDAHSARRD